MRVRGSIPSVAAVFLAVASLALAQGEHGLDLSTLPEAGAVTPEDGLAARDSIPLWGTVDAPDRIHGMAINAGDSRIGAGGLSCNACHQTSTRPNRILHAAPQTGMDWRLAPVAFQWTDRTSAEICAQVRDPA